MATFRTGADGRAVISDDNRVTVQAGDIDRGGFTARERAAGRHRIGANPGSARTINRFEGDRRSGGFGPPVLQDQGTGYMTRQEFENVAGITDTNPYGRDGYFTREHGIDPRKIDYTGILGLRGMENVKRQAYDRFLRPFAQVDAFGRPTMGANAALGITRSGVQPDDLTIYGPAVQSQREGVAGLFENTMLGSLMPKQARIPNYDRNFLLPDLMEGPAVGGGTEPPGVSYFTSSTNPPLAADAPSMEDIKAAREAGNAVPTTVAEVIATEPVAGSVLVNPGESIIPVPETENERIMRERQEAFDAALRRRQQESAAFMDRTNETLDEILRRGDTILTPGVRAGATEPLASDLLSPENVREVFRMPGSSYYEDRPYPVDIIPQSLLAGSR